jgi:hypothetical protein
MQTIDVEILDTNVKTSISKQRSEVYNTKKKIPCNRYELEVALEDKVYPKTYYGHQPRNVIMDETCHHLRIPSKFNYSMGRCNFTHVL